MVQVQRLVGSVGVRLWGGAFLGSLLGVGCGVSDDTNSDFGSALVLTSGGARVIPGCEHVPLQVCDVLEEGCQQQLFALMACLREDDATGVVLPKIERLDVAEAAKRVMVRNSDDDSSDAASMGPSAKFLAEIQGLELLGLVEPGQVSTETDLASSRLDGVLAFYSPVTQAVVLIDRGEPADNLDSNAVLAHELVHALQDAEHDLLSYGESYSDSRDQNLASVALVEGEATLYEVLMRAGHRGIVPRDIDYLRMFDVMTEVAEEATLESGAAYLSSRAIFPYTIGARYAGNIWLGGGSSALDDKYSDPPVSTLEVLYGEPDDETPVQRLEAMPSPLEGYEFLSDDVVGAWAIQSVVRELTMRNVSLPVIGDAGETWRGDRFWLYHREEDGAVAALWKLNWQHAEAAEKFEAMLPDVLSASDSFEVTTQGVTTLIASMNAEASEDAERWAELLAGIDH